MRHCELVVILLGAPNEKDGTLSPIAEQRALKAAEKYREMKSQEKDTVILPTGGKGAHFNESPENHYHWSTKYLLSKCNVPESDILSGVASYNTLTDVYLLREQAIDDYKSNGMDISASQFAVVTSDFHMERAMVIFNHVFPRRSFLEFPAPTPVSAEEMEKLQAHEKKQVEALKTKGVPQYDPATICVTKH